MKFIMKFVALLLIVTSLNAQNYESQKAPRGEVADPEVDEYGSLQKKIPLESSINPETYLLGPGDEIGISIQAGESIVKPLTVTPTGDLFIPTVGICSVAGLSLAEAKKTVQEYVTTQAYPSAKVDMVLVEPRHFLLQVVGAVNQPGFIEVTPVSRLDDVIEEAGGFHQLAEEYSVRVARADGTVSVINFLEFLNKGDLDSNPTFVEKDKITVPFGDLNKSGVVIRGSVDGTGYDIIASGETLGSYIKRQVKFGPNADLKNVTLSRSENDDVQHLVISPDNFDLTELEAKDEINFLWERGIMVNGFVQTPGGFNYYPGYSVADYISLAGGNSINGDPRRVYVIHQNGQREYGDQVTVMRGDVVYVPRARKDVFFGEMSVLGVTVAFLTIYLTYLSSIN